jgi:hypothetical protein
MATIKSYTDLNQSRKLAELLPIESADMHYSTWVILNGEFFIASPNYGNTIEIIQEDYGNQIIPCWSLTALFSVLPTTIGNLFEKNALRLRMDKGENDFNIWYENFDCGDVAEGFDIIEDNPVDACVEMILKLNEQNLL